MSNFFDISADIFNLASDCYEQELPLINYKSYLSTDQYNHFPQLKSYESHVQAQPKTSYIPQDVVQYSTNSIPLELEILERKGAKNSGKSVSKFKNANKYFIGRLKYTFDKYKDRLSPDSVTKLEQIFEVDTTRFYKINDILDITDFKRLLRQDDVQRDFETSFLADQSKNEHAKEKKRGLSRAEINRNKRIWYPIMREVIFSDAEFTSWSYLYNKLMGAHAKYTGTEMDSSGTTE